jgi:hypothetical protein
MKQNIWTSGTWNNYEVQKNWALARQLRQQAQKVADTEWMSNEETKDDTAPSTQGFGQQSVKIHLPTLIEAAAT